MRQITLQINHWDRELRGDSASSVIITIHCGKRTAKKKKKVHQLSHCISKSIHLRGIHGWNGQLECSPSATPHTHYPPGMTIVNDDLFYLTSQVHSVHINSLNLSFSPLGENTGDVKPRDTRNNLKF